MATRLIKRQQLLPPHFQISQPIGDGRILPVLTGKNGVLDRDKSLNYRKINYIEKAKKESIKASNKVILPCQQNIFYGLGKHTNRSPNQNRKLECSAVFSQCF